MGLVIVRPKPLLIAEAATTSYLPVRGFKRLLSRRLVVRLATNVKEIQVYRDS